MNGFILIVFLIFFAGPLFKKIFGVSKPKPKKASNWGQTHEQIKRQAQAKKNPHGHDGTRQQVHKTMHRQDGASVFPEEHQARVRARDLRDKIKNKKMESVIHSRNNRGIIRARSKGRTDWGERAHQGGSKGLIVFIIIVAVIYILFGSQILDLINRY